MLANLLANKYISLSIVYGTRAIVHNIIPYFDNEFWIQYFNYVNIDQPLFKDSI